MLSAEMQRLGLWMWIQGHQQGTFIGSVIPKVAVVIPLLSYLEVNLLYILLTETGLWRPRFHVQALCKCYAKPYALHRLSHKAIS